MEEIDCNRLQEEVVDAVHKSGGISNSELSSRLDEPKSNINYATEKLREKGVIKDTESLNQSKTNFVVKDDVTIKRQRDIDDILNTSVYLHILELVIILAYSMTLAEPLYREFGVSATVFFGASTVILPRIVFNGYKILSTQYDTKVFKDVVQD